MGAQPWYYFVAYESNIGHALQSLRAREFTAGRYHPAVRFPGGPNSPSPGAQHQSIEAAMRAAGENGTRSILDITSVGDRPGYGRVVPLEPGRLLQLYGTTQPTREMVEQNMDFFEDLERGQGIYIILYSDGRPSEICFAGYSYD